MAGLSLGAAAPTPSPILPGPSRQRIAQRSPTSSRTRRLHGSLVLGNDLASVYSSRREAADLGVALFVGRGTLVVSTGMTPAQGRALAHALVAAAEAAESSQHGGSPAAHAAAHLNSEGGLS